MSSAADHVTDGPSVRAPGPAPTTPSQTVGPYFSFGTRWLETTELVDPDDPQSIVVRGSVVDGDGQVVPDALVEIFQADRSGGFGAAAEPQWRGFGRALCSEAGEFAFTTVKPGPVRSAQGVPGAPHIDVSVFARGLLQRVVTRIYFPEEEAANATDAVLLTVSPERRHTLVAQPDGDHLRFDVHLQGEAETVFFNC